MRTTFLGIVLAAAVLGGAYPPYAAAGQPARALAPLPDSGLTSRLAVRVIPLPKEMSVVGSVRIAASQVAVRCDLQDSPPIKTAVGLLRSFALGNERSTGFVLRLRLSEGAPSGEQARLRTRPNSDQAYSIKPLPHTNGLELTANAPPGLLYAARTLAQLVNAPSTIVPETGLEMPLASVTDWPDLAQRGQWGGITASDLAWTSGWKLNLLHQAASVSIDSEGRPTAQISPELIRQAVRQGVNIVPYIAHLEQISGEGAIRSRRGIASTPDPSKPLPSDYTPGLCMSSPATRELVAGWLEQMAGIEGTSEVLVWLSEDRAPCFCESCRGKEPYELEVRCVKEAFDQARGRTKDFRLNLLTSQGSYPVNDKIIALLSREVGLTYYDGGRTYDSSRRPMIYPLLEDYARTGRRLGVYPQITHSWRAVFPWTAPQFLQFRAREFVSKKLHGMIGYAVPANRYHEFNVAAMAEWTWNASGRSPEEFARAYAVRTGIAAPEAFARWAVLAGEAGWALAESGLFLTLIYDPSLGLGSNVPFDHRFQAAGISKLDEFDRTIEGAKKALALAHQTGNRDLVCESECALSGLEAFGLIRSASPALRNPSPEEKTKNELGHSLDKLDRCAEALRARLLEWDARVNARSGAKTSPGRVMDTAFVLFRTCDVFRRKAAALGLADPRPECRLTRLQEWSAEDFTQQQSAALALNVSKLIPEAGGSWSVGFDFIESAYGTEVSSVKAIAVSGRSEKVLGECPRVSTRVSKWESWHELPLDIDPRPAGSELILKVSLSGPPADAPAGRATCSGAVGIRRVGRAWPDTPVLKSGVRP